MTREEAIAALKLEQQNRDREVAHAKADDVLCELLRSLGYGDVVDEFEEVGKWYA